MLQKHSIKIDKTSTKELHLIFVDDCIFRATDIRSVMPEIYTVFSEHTAAQ